MKIHYTVFLSYRRDGAFETASLIAEKLRAAGYEVFLDVESLRSGKFNEQLYAVIEQCSDFILILPEGGLDRCANELDWVRLEILYALKHHKNIVPVMLKGFVWPETMPEGLQGLNEFQSVAAGGYDYFDASMDKLKSYLKSKPGRRALNRYKWIPVSLVIILSILGAVYLGISRYSIPVCKEQADKMTYRIAVIDQLVTESKAIADAWDKYYQEYRQASPKDTAYLNAEIRRTLEFHRQETAKLQKDTARLSLNESQRFFLQFRKVDLLEIETFHHFLYPSFFEDVNHSIDVLELYLGLGNTPEISLFTNEANLKYIRYTANGAYYGYLEFLSDMPKEALETYKELSVHFENLPSSTGLYLPRQEYERLQKLELEKAQSLLKDLGFLNTTQSLLLEQDQIKLKQLGEKVDQREMVKKEMQDRTQHIVELSSDILAKQKLLQTTTDKTEEIMRRIIEKCKLSKEDEQYTMWGKILRLATLMNNTLTNRRNLYLQNEKDKAAAKEKGHDVSHWYEVKYSLTTKDLLEEIMQRLDQYAGYYPETNVYVTTVKRYYTLVEEGKYPLNGMVIMATKDNLPHPVLQIGDIVIARKGMTVNNTTDYKVAKDREGDDSLTFLRLDNSGQLKKATEVVPQTEVLVGFLELKEE